MPIKKIVTWTIIIFLAYYLVTKPHGAANAIHNLLDLLKSAGTALATFLNSL